VGVADSMDSELDSTLSQALALCEPSTKDVSKITRIADKARKLVLDYVSHTNNQQIRDVVFGGSFAKGTWLKGSADVDIFIKMNPTLSEDEFERIGIEIGREALKKYKQHMRYSDHPYIEAFISGVRINVVPCYDVEKGLWKSAADRSPFHTEYILNNFDEDKRKSARLLKKFLKAIGVYGAEIATAGFSGYVCEVMVQRYGSFVRVIEAMSNISEKQIVAVSDDYDKDIVKGFQSSMVIIDPIDPRRNLAAAISPESVGKFVLASRAFMKRPSISFFTENKNKKEKKTKGTGRSILLPNLLAIEFEHGKRSPDVIWGQLKKSMNAISKQLEIAGFTVIRSRCITDEERSAAFVFLLESTTLPAYIERKGPHIFRRKDSGSFIDLNKNTAETPMMWVDSDMRVAVLSKRKITSAKEFARNILLTAKIENSGVTKGIVSDIKATNRKVQIYTGNERRLSGLVKKAVDGITTTERLIFK
jgi:tRNA nucleotidyltransferase (CCA-adding enzyme)